MIDNLDSSEIFWQPLEKNVDTFKGEIKYPNGDILQIIMMPNENKVGENKFMTFLYDTDLKLINALPYEIDKKFHTEQEVNKIIKDVNALYYFGEEVKTSSEGTLKQISNDLLKIAQQPKEERAEKLENLKFLLQSEKNIPKEQLDLIEGILQDLISESKTGEQKEEEKIESIEGIDDLLDDLDLELEGFDELQDELNELENL